jgi:hypothetical protein
LQRTYGSTSHDDADAHPEQHARRGLEQHAHHQPESNEPPRKLECTAQQVECQNDWVNARCKQRDKEGQHRKVDSTSGLGDQPHPHRPSTRLRKG